MRSNNIFIYTVAYSEETLLNAPVEWGVLDNRANVRPDWFEYWPIRNFLLKESLDPNGFYGFFSPKFTQKTGLSPEEVDQFILMYGSAHDVLTFSPFPNFNCHFLNQFQRHRFSSPPNDATFRAAMSAIGIDPAIEHIVADSRNTVYCNYFVARPAFWKAWLELGERFFHLCEDSQHPVSQFLNASTSYSNAQVKIFFIEDLASILLLTQNKWRCKNFDIFKMPWEGSNDNFQKNIVVRDALKIAYQTHQFSEYIQTFMAENVISA